MIVSYEHLCEDDKFFCGSILVDIQWEWRRIYYTK